MSVAPSASSGRKRPLEDTDRGFPPKKKQKKVEEKMLTEEEFRMEIVGTLGVMAVDTTHFTRAAELQNFLLQQLVVALEGNGNGTAYGTLLSEGKLEMEDRMGHTRWISRRRGWKKNREKNRERSWKSELVLPSVI